MAALLVLAVGLLLLVLPFALAWLTLPVGKDCPFCGGETVAVLRPWVHLLHRLAERRWCMRCNWEGFVRGSRPRTRRWRIEAVREQDGEEERSGTSRGM